LSLGCTLSSVWKRGQERMLDVYRTATLDQLAMAELKPQPARPAAAVAGA